jgi:hypothetical protein
MELYKRNNYHIGEAHGRCYLYFVEGFDPDMTVVEYSNWLKHTDVIATCLGNRHLPQLFKLQDLKKPIGLGSIENRFTGQELKDVRIRLNWMTWEDVFAAWRQVTDNEPRSYMYAFYQVMRAWLDSLESVSNKEN